MKAFFKHQPLTNKPPCDELSFWVSVPLWRSQLTFFFARVRRGAAASLAASIKATSNNRTYTGLILMLIVGPLSAVTYQLFDKSAVTVLFEGQFYLDDNGVRQAGWYYSNFHYLLFVLSPHIHMLISLTGIFLVMKEGTRGYLVSIPAAYHIANILWLLPIQSNADFHRVVPGAFLVIALLIALLWLFTFNYLMSLHYHRVLGPVARLKGLRDCPDMPDSQKVQLMGRAAEELEAALKN